MIIYALRSFPLSVSPGFLIDESTDRSIGRIKQVKQAYDDRLGRAAPKLADSCGWIAGQLSGAQSAAEVFGAAAKLYSAATSHSALFACFHHDTLGMDVGSSSGEFGEEARFHSDTPTSNLLLRSVLSQDRFSVHIPWLGGLDRRSILQRIEDSGGEEVFSSQWIDVVLVEDDLVETDAFPSRDITGVLPSGFEPEEGAALLTPLGIERSTDFSFGLILTYKKKGHFSLAEINEARTYSTLFTWLIVSRLIRGINY